MKNLVIIILLLNVSATMFGQSVNQKNENEYWLYSDKYTFKYLKIKEDGSFQYYFRSCMGETKLTGDYTQSGDSIVLMDPSNDAQQIFLRQGNQLLTYVVKDARFSHKRTLTRTKYNTQKKADKNCHRLRKRERRKRRRQSNKEFRQEMKGEV